MQTGMQLSFGKVAGKAAIVKKNGEIFFSLENQCFCQQYYLCYYRDGSLIETSEISRAPYAFRAQNISLGGIEVDQNFDLGAYNISTTGTF